MKKLISIIGIFAVGILFVSAQDANITALEFFIDVDPGVGNATPIPLAPATPVDYNLTIGTGSLTEGFHVLVVRARDEFDEWSIQESRPFYVSATSVTTTANVTAMEYFIDADPGFGNGIPVTISSGTSIDIVHNISTAALSNGFHVLHYRVQDSDGNWAIRDSRPFYVSPTSVTATANVTTLEYFIDTDPGFGNGTSITITAGTSIDILHNISTASLTSGFHVVHYRVRDSDNNWGVTDSRVFFVSLSGVVSQATITNLEYFFDVDPGYGNGIPISITSGTNLNVNALISSASLTGGFHKLHVRAQDSDGSWGISESRSFFVDVLSQITDIEYYVDTDPGIGSATPIPVVPPQSTIDMNVTIPTSALPEGNHTLGMRIKRQDATWSDVQTASFAICSYATPDFATNTVCLGSATTFTDNSSNTLAGDTYQWDFNNDATIDATTVGNANFTYTSAGSYTARLSINRSGCISTVTANVLVETIPTADAGTDQNICLNNTALAASALNTGETGNWTIVTGSGIITNPADPTSTITNITSYSSTLQWTVTKAAGCSSSDQVVIISNQPIVSAPVTTTVSLGQTSNSNVQSPTTINPGDVLTTTILTSPKKGSASTLANGTINYTPNTGTVGKDTVVFQLCNQCSRCSTNNLIVEITNNAPVIDPAPLTAPPGGTVSVNLLSIISDPNNNLNSASLAITQQPISGAIASIDASYNLNIDYSSVVFTGTDQLIVAACDFEALCSSNIISIEVDIPGDPPITVYNAISPNGDGKHDFLEIENISAYPDNIIFIFNRWGDKVFEAKGYNNSSLSFSGTSNSGNGKDLPGGTYYYSIDLGNGNSGITGFLVLKK